MIVFVCDIDRPVNVSSASTTRLVFTAIAVFQVTMVKRWHFRTAAATVSSRYSFAQEHFWVSLPLVSVNSISVPTHSSVNVSPRM